MAGWNDFQQNSRLNQLESEADSSVDSFRTLADKLEREKKRNDTQSARIKALNATVETLCTKLLERRVLTGDDLAADLAALREAMKPVKVT
jgi:hypothetical protein